MLSVQRISPRILLTASLLTTLAVSADSRAGHEQHGMDDVVYEYRATDRTAGMDAMLSRDRATISVGSFVFDLESCSSKENLICLRSKYFNLVVPRSHTLAWSDGQYGFVLVGEQSLAFVGAPEPVLVVSSIQGHSLFTFYLTRTGELLGWTQTSRGKGIPASYLANPSPR